MAGSSTSATRPAHELGWFTNRLMLTAVGSALVLLVLLLTVPPLARLLDQAVPPAAGLVVVLLAAPSVLLADQIHKVVRHRRRARVP